VFAKARIVRNSIVQADDFFDVLTTRELTVRTMKPACLVVFSLFALTILGCGKSNPNAGVPPEKMAPAPDQLGNDPEYAKQFGGKGKK
jgi:hypothetical protein